jgi:rsbT antagonist protein RsbS
MQPPVAQTLIEMGRELVGVETVLNLDQGMEKIEQLIGNRSAGLRRDEAGPPVRPGGRASAAQAGHE